MGISANFAEKFRVLRNLGIFYGNCSVGEKLENVVITSCHLM